MVATPHIGRKLTHKRQERWFLQQAVKQAVQSRLPQAEASRPFYETATPEEWNEAFLEWTESHHDLPPLPPQSYGRAYFYGEGD